jgi:hypothetical protein
MITAVATEHPIGKCAVCSEELAGDVRGELQKESDPKRPDIFDDWQHQNPRRRSPIGVGTAGFVTSALMAIFFRIKQWLMPQFRHQIDLRCAPKQVGAVFIRRLQHKAWKCI